MQRPGLSILKRFFPLATFVLCLAAMIARRHDAITLPQFWAEDGPIFYQPALDGRGAAALFEPWAGYFHLFPRLVAWAASPLPPEWAPAFFNGMGLLAASASVWLFTLALARPLISSDGLRLALALLFILSNPAVETFGNATNAQWWMCVGALVLIGVPLERKWLAIMACGFVGLAALSSPLLVLFVPIVLFTMILGGRGFRAAGLALLMGVSAQILGRVLLTGREPALPEAQGTVAVLRLVADSWHATLLHLFPGYALAAELHEGMPWAGWLLAGLLFALLVTGALWPWSWRQTSLVSCTVFLLIAALVMAAVTRGCCPGQLLLNEDMPAGGRYVFLPYAMCIFLLGLAVQRQLRAPRMWPRIAALVFFGAVATCSIAGVPPMILFEDLKWSQHVHDAREHGSATIPINPNTSEWKVELRMPRPRYESQNQNR